MTGRKPGLLIWITGLPGSGKTTLSKLVLRDLEERGLVVACIDGDVIRRVFGGDLGYSPEDRLLNAWRISRLCAELVHQGLTVVCATVSLFHEVQAFNRAQAFQLVEVYVRVTRETLLARDQKGLYSGALSGDVEDVVGIDQDYELPKTPDLIVDNDAEADPESLAQRIVARALAQRQTC